MQNLYSPVRIRSSPPPSPTSQRERPTSRSLSCVRARHLGLCGLLGLLSCVDPPDPPALPGPADLPRWSTAPYVRWAGPADPLRGPVLVIVDQPGGPLDRLAADADLTTFLNDRFTPFFVIPSAAPGLPDPSVQVLDERGCWLLPPMVPPDLGALVDRLNQVMRDRQAGTPALARPDPPDDWAFPVPQGHPLRRSCATP